MQRQRQHRHATGPRTCTHTLKHTHTNAQSVFPCCACYNACFTIPQLHLQRFGEGQAKALKILGNALVGLEEWQEAVNALKKAHQVRVRARDSRATLVRLSFL
jgi:hypothetical protein